jgi:hypothetical protein
VVIDIDCIGSCNSNYYTIMTTIQYCYQIPILTIWIMSVLKSVITELVLWYHCSDNFVHRGGFNLLLFHWREYSWLTWILQSNLSIEFEIKWTFCSTVKYETWLAETTGFNIKLIQEGRMDSLSNRFCCTTTMTMPW